MDSRQYLNRFQLDNIYQKLSENNPVVLYADKVRGSLNTVSVPNFTSTWISANFRVMCIFDVIRGSQYLLQGIKQPGQATCTNTNQTSRLKGIKIPKDGFYTLEISGQTGATLGGGTKSLNCPFFILTVYDTVYNFDENNAGNIIYQQIVYPSFGCQDPSKTNYSTLNPNIILSTFTVSFKNFSAKEGNVIIIYSTEGIDSTDWSNSIPPVYQGIENANTNITQTYLPSDPNFQLFRSYGNLTLYYSGPGIYNPKNDLTEQPSQKIKIPTGPPPLPPPPAS